MLLRARTPNLLPSPEELRSAKALIISCKPAFLSGGGVDEYGGTVTATTYIVKFEYEVDGKIYAGKFRRYTPIRSGVKIEISYNPARPWENTGSDLEFRWGFNLLAWIIGATVAAIFIYLDNR
jgi:hypothetical protein